MSHRLTHGIVFIGAFVQALLSVMCLWFIQKIPVWVQDNVDTRINERVLWLFIIAGLWWIFLIALHVGIVKYYEMPKRGLALSLGSSVSYIGLMLLVESPLSRVFLLALAGVVFVFLWYWGLRPDTGIIDFHSKPWRRVATIQWLFTVYAIIAMACAADVFFPSTPWLVLGLLGSGYAGLASFFIWHLYIDLPQKNFLLWTAIVVFVALELMWIMHLLPIGYLVQALLLVWVWYVLQLFVRFHWTARGIMWKRQRVFLAVNGLLYILVLYFARWI